MPPQPSNEQCREPERPTTRVLKSESMAAARLRLPFGDKGSQFDSPYTEITDRTPSYLRECAANRRLRSSRWDSFYIYLL